ncbi:unnamed protein product [Ambrosiozyma monospora]|uniref:Unnamed protein product n=1 Tax=Ambrosiozyma monospora TaxID=43982 RepID=A0A9W6Z0V0_AMBMO|nr:unnamed protein product [Ambrosiozyma monospora]
MVKNQNECNICIHYSDRGGEYLNHEMTELMDRYGIRQLTTSGRDSQSNGKSERMNRTLMDSIRANLFSTGLGNEYWPYACNYVVSVMNNGIFNDRINEAPEPFLRTRVGQGRALTSFETCAFGRLVYLTRDSRLIGKFPRFQLSSSLAIPLHRIDQWR